MSRQPLAYLLTFHTYGSWLPGSDKGSVERDNNAFGTAWEPRSSPLEDAARTILKHPPVKLDAARRGAVDRAVRESTAYRSWELMALNVRTNHVHAVVRGEATPEKMLTDLKARATRLLREDGLVETTTRVWSRHGSTRYLWNEASVANAIRYVNEGQGPELPME